jgi:hypothetical protein
MAEQHSTRPKAASASTAPRRHAPKGHLSNKSLRPRSAKAPSAPECAVANRELASQVHGIARLLRVVYSTCVTAELALQGQNGDQDQDILCALRMNVTEPVSRQVEKLDSLAVALAGNMRDGHA